MGEAETVQEQQQSGGEVGLVQCHDFVSKEPFEFERGGVLPEIYLRYETYGQLNADRTNGIMICHALSGDHHSAGVYNVADRKPGWWNVMIGPGKPIDTDRFFVIGSNCLGGCQGSLGPSSVDPKTGKPYNLKFPVVTIRDMVNAQMLLVKHLGISQLYCVIGGSMGGMQALQWAIDYPDVVQRILPLATTARQSAQAIAFNEVGRSAIMQDTEWCHGDYEVSAGPNVGLSIARMMAHITYLSDQGLEHKFGRNRKGNAEASSLFDVEFQVESYLRYQGESFVNRFDANTYLYFTKALDRFDLYGKEGRLEDALLNVKARALVVSFSTDWLFPPRQNRAIAHALLRCGKDVTYAECVSHLGHDSFLVHSGELFDMVRAFLLS